MLVAVSELDTRQQRRALAGPDRVLLFAIECAIERTMIGYVRRVESGARVPRTILLGVEATAPVVRSRCMTVEINGDQFGITYLEEGHRPPRHERDADDRDRSPGETHESPHRFGYRETVARSAMPSRAQKEERERAGDKSRPILRGRENGKRVENSRGGRDDVICERPSERCDDQPTGMCGVNDRRQRKNRRHYESCGNHERPSITPKSSYFPVIHVPRMSVIAVFCMYE